MKTKIIRKKIKNKKWLLKRLDVLREQRNVLTEAFITFIHDDWWIKNIYQHHARRNEKRIVFVKSLLNNLK